MKVYLLTEGGSEKGFGHISRIIALYQAFQAYEITPECIVSHDGELAHIMDGLPYRNIPWTNESGMLPALIANSDIVVVDSYVIDNALSRRISDCTRVSAFLDDDFSFDRSNCILINGNILAQELYIPRSEDVHYLLGSEFMLLRKVFWDVQAREVREEVRRVFMTLGGKDIRGLLPAISRMLRSQYPKIEQCVVDGEMSEDLRRTFDAGDGRIEILNRPDSAQVKDAMFSSDLAISAGGQTLNELARMGIPTIAVAIADNQLPNLKAWEKEGFIESAGNWDDPDLLKKIEAKMDLMGSYDLRTRMAQAGAARVDGAGARRVVKTLLNIHKKYQIEGGPSLAIN